MGIPDYRIQIMRKYILILCLVASFGAVKAQDSTKVRKVHYGFRLNFNELYTSHSANIDQLNSPTMKSFTNFSGAFVVDIKVAKNVSIQPAIEYLTKGQQRKDYNSSQEQEYRVKYWQLPVTALYHYKKFYIGAGPFASIAKDGTYAAGSVKKDLKFGNDYYVAGSKRNKDWREYDYGVTGTVGYNLWKFHVGVRYDLGLVDVDPHPNYKSQTRRASIEVALLF